MFVRCPACLTQFRVRAEHLTAAAGRVRCGACGQAFDAISRLSDRPLPPATDPYNTAAPVESVSSFDTDVVDFKLPQDMAHDMSTVEVDEADEYGDIPHISTGPDSAINKTPGSAAVETVWVDVEEEEQKRPRHTGRWIVLALLLLLVGLGQAAWFHRDMVYNRFPQVLPWVEKLCERLQCQVYRQRQPTAFELLNRDVRAHPVYEDALLVNATIVNRAETRQPYPRIQLALFDTSGRPLAYRQFAPAEYLDNSLPVSAGMPPQAPVHVVLELSGATDGAVSFEFGFL